MPVKAPIQAAAEELKHSDITVNEEMPPSQDVIQLRHPGTDVEEITATGVPNAIKEVQEQSAFLTQAGKTFNQSATSISP